MSAIAGIYNLSGEPVSIEQSGGMMKAFEKFPADDIQTWHKENIFLGCHAQWITPESIGEQLPFYDYQRQLAITADAIIDNREELFERLQIDREDRKKITDSQLILLAYHKWGEESPKFLVGDFAFMIWDEKERKLFGARDFSGARTLYYYRDNQRFGFSTTIQPLFSLPGVKKELNEQWLAEYLAIVGMIDVVDPYLTVYEAIQQIPPSHSITIKSKKISFNRYCTLYPDAKLKLKTNEEYVEAFKETFEESVNSRLRTYRQVGAQLSGGLDSGSIVSFAGKGLRNLNKTLHTFSYVPPNDFKDFTPRNIMPDESPFIKSTVKYVGGIKARYLDFQGRDPYTEIQDFLEVMEMPYKFFENSFWLKGMFEQAQEEDVGVLLNGGRGNLSISWGSAIDFYALLLRKLSWVRLIKELDHYSKITGGSRFRRLPLITRTAFPFLNHFQRNRNVYEFPSLINSELAKRTKVFNKLKENGMDESGWFASPNIYVQRKRHFTDVCHWNASNTLAAKLSLPYCLWKRDPTNDIRVIRYCISLPENQYVQNGMDRALIRRSTENLLPDGVRLNQRIKGVQGADWVHRMIPHWNKFYDDIQQLSQDQLLMEYVNPAAIKESLQKVAKDPRPEYATDPNYKILMRCLILKSFIRNSA